ncbi:MAG: EAL domain-containing protein [Proteobacteria bacterium]|nr:EAL domain-containing protein [Pseudomonadota bacterium]
MTDTARLPRATPPRWMDALVAAVLAYALTASLCVLLGVGGVAMRFLEPCLDVPGALVATVLITAAARRTPPGTQRTAWRVLAAALWMYLAGTSVAAGYWLRNVDPFPGPPDIFYCGFYLTLTVAACLLIRAAAVRAPWARLAADAAILVIGFGACFWFLVVGPVARSGGAGQDLLPQLLSLGYTTSDCILMLLLGVLLIAGTRSGASRRVPVLLMAGFAMLFMGDLLWSLTDVRGLHIPQKFRDVLYLCCHVPLAFAGREQVRAVASGGSSVSRPADWLLRLQPYAALLAALIMLIRYSRDNDAGPAQIMTLVVFALALLLMVRQAVELRSEARARERRAALIVEARYASLIANASDVIMIVSPEGAVRFASPACERIFGMKPADMGGRVLVELCAADDRGKLRQFLSGLLTAPPATAVGPTELRVDAQGGRTIIECVGSNLTADAAVQGLALNFRDISERKQLEEQLRRLAFHDPLTLLANRNLFRDRVQHALALAQRDHSPVAVMFLDLDNFKNVNDTLGHDAGDQLLQIVAQRIARTTRSSDTVARLGGDEFAVLVEGLANAEEAQRLADALIAAIDQPVALSSAEVRIGVSIGIAFSPELGGSAALLSNADIAMYHAKAAGKNRHAVFRPQMQDLLQERMRLEADVNLAFDREEFFLDYQPIVDLGSRCLLGVEALVRWRHPELGILMPARFIPLLEESGHVRRLGRWVLERASRELCNWRGCVAGGEELRLAVNISGRHLQHGDLAADVARALQLSGLEPHNLVIELTESTTMYSNEGSLARFRELKELAVRVAIDDFGIGYSSLSYLHRFPIDILKIDRSFVGRLTDSDKGPELASAVITLGATMGLDTVAEGVESELQALTLIRLGCVAGQGYLFGAPASLAELAGNAVVERRNVLWDLSAERGALSPTGCFRALRVPYDSAAGAA